MTADVRFAADPPASFGSVQGQDVPGSATGQQVTIDCSGPPPDVNHPPQARDDAGALYEDSSAWVSVLANDQDVDGDPLRIGAFTQPAQGVVALAADGGLVYTPTHDFAGVDAFSYVASDGVLTATTAVTVTVNPVNDPPLAQADVVTVTHSAPVTLTVLANDVDVDGDELIIESVAADGLQGQLDWDGEQIVYTPAADFEGVEGFRYVVSDGVVTATAPVEVRAIMAAAALDLHLDPSVETTVQPGQAISYTLDVVNTGRLPLTGVELRTQIPENVAVVKVVSSLGGRSRQPRQSGTELVWQVQELDLNQRLHVEFVLRPDAALRGSALNVEATFRSDQIPLLRTQPVTVQVGEPVVGQTGGQIFLPLVSLPKKPVGGSAGPTRVYLPHVGRAPVLGTTAGLPDLVVEQVQASGDAVLVTLVNRGGASVTDEFWVDVYIAPRTPPTRVNQVWTDLADRGLVWGVTASALPILPGHSITLTLGDAYYSPAHSNFAGGLATGTPIYAQVDSFNAATNYGAIWETHEKAGDPYNNVAGPVLVTAAEVGGLGPNGGGAPRTGGRFTPLPARPAR